MGRYKEKNGKSRLETFINKAGALFPDLLDVGVMVGTGNILGAIDTISGKLKDYSKGDGDMSLEAKKLLYEFEHNGDEHPDISPSYKTCHNYKTGDKHV